MPRRPHSVGVSVTGEFGVCVIIALIMACALPGNGAMGTTGVPQSLPMLQSAVFAAPAGNVPSPMSIPFDIGSFTNAVIASVEFCQLCASAGGGKPVTMLPERSCMMKSATGVYVYVVSVTDASL